MRSPGGKKNTPTPKLRIKCGAPIIITLFNPSPPGEVDRAAGRRGYPYRSAQQSAAAIAALSSIPSPSPCGLTPLPEGEDY